MDASGLIPELKEKILRGARMSKTIWWRKVEGAGVSVKYTCTAGQYARGKVGMLEWIEYIPVCPYCKNAGWVQKTKLLCGRLIEVPGELEPCANCCALDLPPPKPALETRHMFVPAKGNPFSCGECGYAEHVDLKHLPACVRCKGTHWVPDQEPWGGLMREIEGVRVPCPVCNADGAR